MAALTIQEKHALIDASHEFEGRGVYISMPWECDQDDREREMFEALLAACRAYAAVMNKD